MKIPEPRKLKSGSWFIQLRLDGQSIPITAADKATCKQIATLTKAQWKAGQYTSKTTKSDLTLTEAIDVYIAGKSNILSPATIRGYRIIQRNRFQSVANTPLSKIPEKKWAAIVNDEAALCSPKTLKNAWGFVSSVLAQQLGAAPSVQLPQVMPAERTFLDPDEIKSFVEVVAGTPCEIAALLALHSLRRSEIMGLTWENIDLEKKLIYVRAAMVPDENHQLIAKETTKNRSSSRTVPIMLDQLYDALRAAQQPTGPVVTRSPDKINHRIAGLCTHNGLPVVTLHGLRHSFASLAYYLRIPEKITMQIGGWSDDQTMRKIYTHIASKALSQSVTAISGFLNSTDAAETADPDKSR